MLGIAINLWKAVCCGGGASTAGQPVGLLLILTKAS